MINEAGNIQHDRNNMNFHVMVDGEVLSNYPVHIFDSTKYIYPDLSINMYQQNKFTLGLLLDKPEQFHYKQPGNYPLPIHTINGYVTAVYLHAIVAIDLQ